MMTTGYMTLEPEANINSKIGGVLLSFFILFFIVYLTPKMNSFERILKFGSGYTFYFIIFLIAQGIGRGLYSGMVSTGLFPCLIISLSILFYGNVLLRTEK